MVAYPRVGRDDLPRGQKPRGFLGLQFAYEVMISVLATHLAPMLSDVVHGDNEWKAYQGLRAYRQALLRLPIDLQFYGQS
jgi:hypothetical protein